jgi:hypothetical protein
VRGRPDDGIDVVATILILGTNNVVCFALGALCVRFFT